MESLAQTSEGLLNLIGFIGLLIYITWPLTPALALIVPFVLFGKLDTPTATFLWTLATSAPVLILLGLKHLADNKNPEWIFNLQFFQQSYSQAYFLGTWIVFAVIWSIVLAIVYHGYVKSELSNGLGIWR